MNLPMTDDVRTLDGGAAPWSSFFQRKNLLVLFAEEGDDACDRAIDALRSLDRGGELEGLNATPIVVYRDRPMKPPEGLTVLLDPERHLADRLEAGPGQLLAVDRFFEVLKILDVHEGEPAAAVAEADGWIELAESSCPECGVGTW